MTTYVRVKDTSTGHTFSTPVRDPLIKKGLLEVTDETPISYLLPPKPHKNLDPAVRAEEAAETVQAIEVTPKAETTSASKTSRKEA